MSKLNVPVRSLLTYIIVHRKYVISLNSSTKEATKPSKGTHMQCNRKGIFMKSNAEWRGKGHKGRRGDLICEKALIGYD